MWSDKIYNFIAKNRDGTVILGVPAICVSAFLLLQIGGAELLGTVGDYVSSIALFYGAIGLVICFLGLIAAGCDRIDNWRLRAMQRRLYRAELEAQARALEASCTPSRD